MPRYHTLSMQPIVQRSQQLAEQICHRCQIFTPAWRNRCIHCAGSLTQNWEAARKGPMTVPASQAKSSAVGEV
jgi:predicted amidophosphoribosyltransferase